MSAESTERSAFVSPTRTPKLTDAVMLGPPDTVTPVRPTVTYWSFVIPVRLTVHWSTLGPLVTVPMFALPQLEIADGKVNTSVYSPLGPPVRHSMPGLPANGRSTSNVPAAPWILRETTRTVS